MLHIATAGQFQIGLDFPIDRMLNHDILHPSAIINDSQKFGFDIVCLVFEFKEPMKMSGFIAFFIEIAPISTDNRSTIGPQQSNILNDNLTSDMKLFRQKLSV